MTITEHRVSPPAAHPRGRRGPAGRPPPARAPQAARDHSAARAGARALRRCSCWCRSAVAVYYSLYKWNGFGRPTDFVGLDNYSRALTDDVFLRASAHNADHRRCCRCWSSCPLGARPRAAAQPAVPRAGGVAAAGLRAVRAVRGITAVIWLLHPAAATAWSTSCMRAVGLGGLVQLLAGRPERRALTRCSSSSPGSTSASASSCSSPGCRASRASCTRPPRSTARAVADQRHITMPLLGPDDPDLDVPVDDRLAAGVRRDLGHDRAAVRRTRPTPWPRTWSTTASSRYEFGYGSAVAVILFIISLHRSRCCSSASCCAATPRARMTGRMGDRRDPRSPWPAPSDPRRRRSSRCSSSRSWRSSSPLVYVVLGGFRTTGADRRAAGRPARPVGLATNYRRRADRPTLLAPAAATAR